MNRRREPAEAAQPAGNFADLSDLFDELDAPPLFRLGCPAPDEKYLPKARAGSCPAAHNRALVGEDMH